MSLLTWLSKGPKTRRKPDENGEDQLIDENTAAPSPSKRSKPDENVEVRDIDECDTDSVYSSSTSSLSESKSVWI